MCVPFDQHNQNCIYHFRLSRRAVKWSARTTCGTWGIYKYACERRREKKKQFIHYCKYIDMHVYIFNATYASICLHLPIYLIFIFAYLQLFIVACLLVRMYLHRKVLILHTRTYSHAREYLFIFLQLFSGSMDTCHATISFFSQRVTPLFVVYS